MIAARRARTLGFAAWLAAGPLVAACGEARPWRTVGVGEAVGSIALEDLDGRRAEVASYGEHAVTVLWFWSTLCPCVEQCEERIVALLRDYAPRGMRFVAVDPNAGDDAARIRALLATMRSPYGVLRDPTAHEALRLGIRASASVAVIDRDGRLRYRGAIDDRLEEPTVSYVRQALDAVLAGRDPRPADVPSYGCLFPIP